MPFSNTSSTSLDTWASSDRYYPESDYPFGTPDDYPAPPHTSRVRRALGYPHESFYDDLMDRLMDDRSLPLEGYRSSAPPYTSRVRRRGLGDPYDDDDFWDDLMDDNFLPRNAYRRAGRATYSDIDSNDSLYEYYSDISSPYLEEDYPERYAHYPNPYERYRRSSDPEFDGGRYWSSLAAFYPIRFNEMPRGHRANPRDFHSAPHDDPVHFPRAPAVNSYSRRPYHRAYPFSDRYGGITPNDEYLRPRPYQYIGGLPDEYRTFRPRGGEYRRRRDEHSVFGSHEDEYPSSGAYRGSLARRGGYLPRYS